MKFNIKINEEAVSREIPNAWHMVTFRQSIALFRAGEDIEKIISVFTGIDPEVIKTAKIKNFNVLMSCLSFLKKPMNMVMPSTCLGIKVPDNIEEEAVSRYADIQAVASKFTEEDRIGNIEQYPIIAATYLTPSPYNYKEAEKLAERLWDAPCVEVMAIANFTLVRLIESRSGTLNSSHLAGTLRNRLRQATINWLNRLAFTIRYGTWKRSLPSHVRNSLNGR